MVRKGLVLKRIVDDGGVGKAIIVDVILIAVMICPWSAIWSGWK